MTKILLVEDDGEIRRDLGEFLRLNGFDVTAAGTQQEALSLLAEQSFALALIDVMLPDGSGFCVCKAAKEENGTPVIFLTACADEMSAVTGLDMGGDDYIRKPYRPNELVSRIKSVLRRTQGAGKRAVFGSLSVDEQRGTVTKDGRELALSALEYRLLLTFIHHEGTVLTRNRLLEEIWDAGGEFVTDNALSVHIKRLRGKIEDDPEKPEMIRTVKGFGYVFKG